MFFEGTLTFLVQLIAIGNLAQCSYHHLSRQLEAFRHIVVAQVMQFERAKKFVFPGQVVIAGSVGLLQGVMQRLTTIGVRIELDFCRQFHMLLNSTPFRLLQTVERRGHANLWFDPQPKVGPR